MPSVIGEVYGSAKRRSWSSFRDRLQFGARELRIRLPAHHIGMLEYRTDEQAVSGVLARELDGISSAHIDDLSAALPGFAEVMAWPGLAWERGRPARCPRAARYDGDR